MAGNQDAAEMNEGPARGWVSLTHSLTGKVDGPAGGWVRVDRFLRAEPSGDTEPHDKIHIAHCRHIPGVVLLALDIQGKPPLHRGLGVTHWWNP